MMDLLPPGTETVYGVVQAIHSKGGERSYLCIDEDGAVTLMPADLMREEDLV